MLELLLLAEPLALLKHLEPAMSFLVGSIRSVCILLEAGPGVIEDPRMGSRGRCKEAVKYEDKRRTHLIDTSRSEASADGGVFRETRELGCLYDLLLLVRFEDLGLVEITFVGGCV